MGKPTTCGLDILTWGTEYGQKSGLWPYLNRKLYGESIGHAALMLTIADTQENRDLINKYCISDDDARIIPFEEKKVRFANGEEEFVLQVFFSCWGLTDPFLDFYPNQDRFMLHKEFDWEPEAQDFEQEFRLVPGFLSNKVISLGPLTIQHQRDLSADDYTTLNNETRNYRAYLRMQSLEILERKLKRALKHSVALPLTDNAQLLIHNMLGENAHKYLQDTEVSLAACAEMLAEVKDQIAQIQKLIATDVGDIPSKYNIEDYLTIGLRESGAVHLPLQSSPDDILGVNVEAILSQMRAEVGADFHVDVRSNCSEISAKVLEAGLQQPHLKGLAAERNNYLAFETPQNLYQSALKIQASIYRGEKSTFWQKIKRLNPVPVLQRAAGYLYMIIADDEASNLKKALAVFGIILIALPIFTLKAIGWPLVKLGDLVDSAVSKLSQTSLGEHKIAPRTEQVTSAQEIKAAQNLAHETEIGKYLNKKIIEVDNQDPLVAIRAYAEVLNKRESIPVFAEKTKLDIVSFIKLGGTLSAELQIFLKNQVPALPAHLDWTNTLQVVDALQEAAIEFVNELSRTEQMLNKGKTKVVFTDDQNDEDNPAQDQDPNSDPNPSKLNL